MTDTELKEVTERQKAALARMADAIARSRARKAKV